MRKSCDFECVLRQVSMLSFLPVVLSCVLGVFNSPAATPAHGLYLNFRWLTDVTIYLNFRWLTNTFS